MSEWNPQRQKVWEDRYARKDENGQPVEKFPAEMWKRVANAMGDNDAEREDFYSLLSDFKFVPGGRILAGAGTGHDVTFYNCYVIPIETEARRYNRRPDTEVYDDFRDDPGCDSREAIFDTIGRMVNIMSRGGGVGINWSVLRPEGAYLKSVNGTSSGPVGWMNVASHAVGEVEQGGSRRGAAMFMLDDWHPDVLRFVNEKRDFTKITNANISVAVSDRFMEAVANDEVWGLGFPDTTDPHYNAEWDGNLDAWMAKGYGWITYREIPARELWDQLVAAAHASGEPGLIFMERYNRMSTAGPVERIACVNPCGEQGLGPYSVCNLGAMNLTEYLYVSDDGSRFGAVFDWQRFEMDVRMAIRFLDAAIDKQDYAWMPETEKVQKHLIRRIGLSTMGLADTLIYMGIRYGSQAAVNVTREIYRIMKIAALDESAWLAAEKGAAEGWTQEMLERPYLASLESGNAEERRTYGGIKEYGLRNLLVLTQAPTGTTSILAGVNSGIEPYFAFLYGRHDRTGDWDFIAPIVKEYEELHPGEGLPDYFVTANNVTVEEHIAMQAAAQEFIDSSVSKTLNAPNSHTVEDVDKAYRLAYDSGLKSIAYYRDGSRNVQVLTHVEPKPEPEPQVPELKLVKYTRPKRLNGFTTRINTDVGTAFITVNTEGGRPVEVFVNVGKAGTDINDLAEALARVISIGLQEGLSPKELTDQLYGVGGYSRINTSLPTAIATAVFDAIDEPLGPSIFPEEVTTSPEFFDPGVGNSSGELCPDCQNFSVVREEGCSKCHICGYSAC